MHDAQVVAAQRAWRGVVVVRRAQAALLVAQLSALEAEVWRAQQAAARGGEPGPDAPPPAWGAFVARGAAVAATRRERSPGACVCRALRVSITEFGVTSMSSALVAEL